MPDGDAATSLNDQPRLPPGRLAVSVALCTHNGAAYVMDQLESICNQTRTPDQLVVLDDASTDATPEILEVFARSAPFPVLVVHGEENVGWVELYFDAFRRCSGDVVAFCDQDDVWFPDKLERCVRLFEQDRRLALVVHSATVVDSELTDLGIRVPDFPKSRILSPKAVPLDFLHQGFALLLAAWLRDVFETTRLPPEISAAPDRYAHVTHDYWACLVAPAVGPVAVVADSLALYRRHRVNTSGQPVVAGRQTFRRHSLSKDPYLRLERQRVGGSHGVRGLLDLPAKTERYLILARARECFASYLEDAARRPGAPAGAIGPRAALHRRAATLLRRRAAAVTGGLLPLRRWGRILALVVTGGYGSTAHGGLGSAALAVDLVVATLGPAGCASLSRALGGGNRGGSANPVG